MDDKKTLREWEQECGFIVKDASEKELNKQFTQSEAWARAVPEGDRFPHGVSWNDRLKFLEDNGYEPTRENIANGDLPNTSTPEPDLSQQLVDELEKMKDNPDEAE